MHNFDQKAQNSPFNLNAQAGRVKTELLNMSQYFLGLSSKTLLYHELVCEIKNKIHCKNYQSSAPEYVILISQMM